MLSNFGFGEVAVLALLAMLVFGPEKLPRAAMDAARVIKKLRSMADGAVSDFRSELPPGIAELDLRSMNPRRIVTDALLGDRGDSGRGDSDGPDGDRPVTGPELFERNRPPVGPGVSDEARRRP